MNKYFKCHQCGKCCNSPPMLNFLDISKHYKNFILSTYIKTILVDSIKDLNLKSHYEKVFLKTVNAYNQECFVSVFPVGYSYKSVKKCPQLKEDGKCGIYDSRPLICKIVPVSATIPESQQFLHSEQMDLFIKEGCLTTDKKDGFTIIYENNKISNPFKQTRIEMIDEIEKSKNIVEKPCMLLNPNNLIHKDNAHYKMNLILLLICMIKENLLNKSQIKPILEAQVELIENTIKQALIRYNKSDREQTQELRSYIEAYKIALDDYDNSELFT